MFNTNLTQNSEWIRDTSSLARRSPDAAGRVQFRVLPCLLSPFFQLDNGFLTPPAARLNTGPPSLDQHMPGCHVLGLRVHLGLVLLP